MKIPRIVVLLFFCAVIGWGQQLDPAGQPRTIPLWENGAPGALGNEERDKPTLTVYPVWTANQRGRATSSAGVIIAPGGGYSGLAMNHEGRQVANFFNSLGVTAFVLRYRLGPQYRHPIELGDAQRAIRMVRARAKEFGVSPDRVGMMGFSAGGHLTSTAGTHFDAGDPQAADPIDRVSSRPDFIILGYPVISFTAPYAHKGSAEELAGRQSRSEAARGPFQRAPCHSANSAGISIHHQRGHRCACGEQCRLLPRPAQGRCPGGDAHIREGPARARVGPRGSGLERMAEAAGELAAGERTARQKLSVASHFAGVAAG